MSELLPAKAPKPDLIQKTDFKPSDPKDKASPWRRLADFFRQNIGLRPLHLAERFAEAKVRQEELRADQLSIENQAKMLKARADYEQITASIEIDQRDSKGRHAKDLAEVANSQEDVKLKVIMREKFESGGKSPEEAWKRVEEIITEIEFTHGGRVEIEPPELFDAPQLPGRDSADEDA